MFQIMFYGVNRAGQLWVYSVTLFDFWPAVKGKKVFKLNTIWSGGLRLDFVSKMKRKTESDDSDNLPVRNHSYSYL